MDAIIRADADTALDKVTQDVAVVLGERPEYVRHAVRSSQHFVFVFVFVFFKYY